MRNKPKTAYIYRIYGIHLCFNVVTNNQHIGEAVLIRAIEPIQGQDIIRKNRNGKTTTDGPAKLTQALGITMDLNGHDLNKPPLTIEERETDRKIRTTTRIGISKAKDKPYRFVLE